MFVAVYKGREIKEGELLESFRKELYQFINISAVPRPGSTGKVLVKQGLDGRPCEYYPQVFPGSMNESFSSKDRKRMNPWRSWTRGDRKPPSSTSPDGTMGMEKSTRSRRLAPRTTSSALAADTC